MTIVSANDSKLVLRRPGDPGGGGAIWCYVIAAALGGVLLTVLALAIGDGSIKGPGILLAGGVIAALCGAMVVFGFFLEILHAEIIATLDKAAGLLTVERVSARSKRVKKYRLNGFEKAEVELVTDSDGPDQYCLNLYFAGNGKAELGYGQEEQPEQQACQRIVSFLRG